MTILMILCLVFSPQRIHQFLDGYHRIENRNHIVFPIKPSNKITISGTITVQGNAPLDISFFITDYENYEKFVNGKEFDVYMDYNRIRLKQFKITLEAGDYYLVFDNTHSAFTPKMIHADVKIYDQR